MSSVIFVVGCTKRKTAPTTPGLTAGNVVADDWIGRLENTRATTSAADLYAGDAWRAAISAPVSPWVCSAGYGLIDSTTLLSPYEATFSPGSPALVAPDPAGRSAWWGRLCRWPGPNPSRPRSLAALAESFPSAFLLVALSPAYLAAVRADLDRATDHLGEPRVAVVCVGLSSKATSRSLLPCEGGKLRSVVGGSAASINNRIARRLLAEASGTDLSFEWCRQRIVAWAAGASPAPRPSRAAQSDEVVLDFLRSALAESPRARPGPLLGRFRAGGRACEASRFKKLYLRAGGEP